MGSRYSWDRRPTNSTVEEFNSSNMNTPLPIGCVKYFVAGHLLRRRERKRYRAYASTYLSFSPDGTELLSNLGSEQIYLFDVLKPSKPKFYETDSFLKNGYQRDKDLPSSSSVSNGYHLNGTTNSYAIKDFIPQNSQFFKKCYPHKSPLPSIVDKIKCKANEMFENSHYKNEDKNTTQKRLTFAISLYNRAISMCPNAAVLYANRAMAYMKREWAGDLYDALRDCYKALSIDSEYVKAHYRLVRCLYELEWHKEAYDCLESFTTNFTKLTKSDKDLCDSLFRDIQRALNSKSDNKSNNSRNESNDTLFDISISNGSGVQYNMSNAINNQEKEWRVLSYDYKLRFCGHCNTTTDIKEANFFGRFVLLKVCFRIMFNLFYV